ncbi:hypothetical protein HDV00_001969 [Rhizophlyctis rosea]|nr:hypothetical protein HDV00_001969 [Rhizophlyctis rosea]
MLLSALQNLFRRRETRRNTKPSKPLRPTNATCIDIPDPPQTYTDETSSAWHNWLTTYINWQPNLIIKDITIIRTHTWTTTHEQYKRRAKHTVRYLYHGTPERNIAPITTAGFQTSPHGTWLATNPTTSVGYCFKECRYTPFDPTYQPPTVLRGKLILCCALIRRGMDTFDGNVGFDGSVAVMKSPERVVPIAVIEFEQNVVY